MHAPPAMLDWWTVAMPKRSLDYVAWGLPLLVCLALYYKGLSAWFVQDDFGSLLLAMHTQTWDEALNWLVQPLAQGVLRPLPDAYFYIVTYKLAGLNAWAYRAVVFATQFANLLLLTAVTRRIAGSPWPALVGTLVWATNVSLVVGMVWTSAFSQVLCCFFWLAGFLLFLKHVETGRWAYWWAQCAAFLLGLATLEITVVYPVFLIAYCLLLERRHAWKVLPLAVIAAVWAAMIVWLIPRADTGPYAMHFDAEILRGIWLYWRIALGVFIFARDWPLSRAVLWALTFLLTGGLVGALLRAEPRRRRLAIAGFAWFFLALAPVLPLRDQRMDYYLTVPSIGLALAVAALLPSVPRWAAALWLGVYFVCSVTFIPAGLDSWYTRSQSARRLLDGAAQARRAHPGSALLLAGVDNTLFYSAIYDHGLDAAGVSNIFVIPDGKVAAKPGFGPLDRYELPPSAVPDALASRSAEVYRVSPDGDMRNVTGEFSVAGAATGAPAWVDIGLPSSASVLGEGWHGAAGGIRWMNRRGELRLRGPAAPGKRLHLRAIYPYRNGEAVQLTVFANNVRVGHARIHDPASGELTFLLPNSLVGTPELKIVIEADHTHRAPGDVRDLSVAFGVIEII